MIFVVSGKESSDPDKALKRRVGSVIVSVGVLEILDKAEVVRKTLSVSRKELDESAFNNQVKFLFLAWSL